MKRLITILFALIAAMASLACSTVEAPAVSGIEVDGELFQETVLEGTAEAGISVKLLYADGTKSQPLLSSDFTLSGYNKDTPGKQTITVKYKDFVYTHSVTVIGRDWLQVGKDKAYPDVVSALSAASEGSTVFLFNGSYDGVQAADGYYYTVIDKRVTLTGLASAQLGGIIDIRANGVTLDGLNFRYEGKDTVYGNVVVYADHVTIKNCNFYAEYTHKLDGGAGTEGGVRFGFMRLNLTNSENTVSGNTFTTNAMAIFILSKNTSVSNNTFKNLNGYSFRTPAINHTDMQNVRITGNAFYNRHLVIGGEGEISGNTFLERGLNETGKTAYYFWHTFKGKIQDNDYGNYGDVTELYGTYAANSPVIPEIN